MSDLEADGLAALGVTVRVEEISIEVRGVVPAEQFVVVAG